MRNLLILLSSAVLAVSLIGCDENASDQSNATSANTARIVAVETLVIEPGDFRDAVRITGTVESMNDAVISAEASGRVHEVLRRGSEVREGDVVARLDESLLQATVDVARATYRLAEDAFQRQEPLHEEGIITPLEFSRVRSQRDQARAQLQQAERQLENTSITAPFSGRIEEKMVDRGEWLSPGNPVVRLVNTDRVRISAGVPERYAHEVREGTDVSLNLSAYREDNRQAEVTFAGNVIRPETRTFAIEVEIDNSDRFFKPEMTVELLVTRSFREDAITVPRTALIRDETGMNVFTVNREQERPVAEFRAVVTGRSAAGQVLILEGLQAGDEVIVAGQSNLNEGDQVRVDKDLFYDIKP